MFAIRFKALRKENRFSQASIAEKLDLSQSTVASWENGSRKPTMEDIPKIAEFFDVSIDYLLGVVDDPHANKQPDESPRISLVARGMEGMSEEEQDRFIAMAKAAFPDVFGK